MCEEAEEREAEEALDEEAVTRKYRTIFEESRYVLHIGRR